jgi:diacylglycerol kinase (ATP)
MRKAFLLYNPLSGRRRERRLADVEAVLAVLRSADVQAYAAATQASSGTTEQTRQAVAEGFDTVFACGGDGTVHDVLQGLVGTEVALGVIPLGTANSLAHDLGLPHFPVDAARAALNANPLRIAVGHVQYKGFDGKLASRYFTVAVGIGVDAQLFYKLAPAAKRQFGMVAYCVKAIHLWLTHKMENFALEIAGGGPARRVEVSQLLAVRIRNFGGVLRELAPEAALERDDFRAVLFRTRSRIAYLRYVIRGLLGGHWNVPGVELIHGTSATCEDLWPTSASSPNSRAKSRIFVEADGELLGTLPASITMVRDAVALLVPARKPTGN